MGRAKKLFIALGALGGAFALVGALHMPFARPLLMRLGGCPASSPVAIDAARKDAIASSRGTAPAPARPALGFALDEATVTDVRAWAARVGAKCDEKRDVTLVKCTGAAGYAEVAFGLSPHTKKVVAVTTLRSNLTGAEGVESLVRVGNELHAALGAPTTTAGDPNALALEGFHTATIAYAYSDYLATVTATKLPERGVLVREEYYSARN
jgi:hypothetical protein